MSEAHSTINVSYWVDSTEGPRHPFLDGDVEVDVAVVGAGIVGLTAARLFKRAGKTVAVLEMDRVGRGVTGYTTAKVTAGHSLIYQQLEKKHGEEVANARIDARRHRSWEPGCWCKRPVGRHFRWVLPLGHKDSSSIERQTEISSE